MCDGDQWCRAAACRRLGFVMYIRSLEKQSGGFSVLSMYIRKELSLVSIVFGRHILCFEVCSLDSACLPPNFEIIMASVHVRYLESFRCVRS